MWVRNNRLGDSATVEAYSNATVTASLLQRDARETVESFSLKSASFGVPSGGYWVVKRGSDVVMVVDSTTTIDVAGNGGRIDAGSANVTFELVGTGNGYFRAQFRKRSTIDPSVVYLYESGTRVAAIGDSRTNITFSASNTFLENYSYMDRVTMGTRARARHLPEDNYGTSGDTTANVYARVDEWVSSDCQVAVILAGTNDRGSANMTLAQSQTNMLSILSAWTGYRPGRLAIVVAETPRYDAAALSGQQLQNHIDYNAWLSGLSMNSVVVVDVWDGFANTDCVDGLHFNATGAFKVGDAVAAVLDKRIEPGEVPPLAGNPVVNHDMTGTGGTKSGSATGTVADGWSLVRSTTNVGSLTLAGAKVVRHGREWQEIVVAGTPTAINVSELRQQVALSSTPFVVGDTVVARCEQEIDAGSAFVGGTPLRLRAMDASNNVLATVEHGDYYSGAASYLTADAQSGVRETPPMVIPEGTTGLRLTVNPQCVGGNAALTTRVGRFSIGLAP